ncbi:MAG: hypothetical protein ACTSPI_10270 [Candidatus Heimdallarchaeaceae archaeon]
MGLDEAVFLKGIEKIVMFFPNWNIKTEDKEVMRNWYEIFKCCDDKAYTKMIDEYIKKENYQPTVAGLNKYYKAPIKKAEFKFKYKEV